MSDGTIHATRVSRQIQKDKQPYSAQRPAVVSNARSSRSRRPSSFPFSRAVSERSARSIRRSREILLPTLAPPMQSCPRHSKADLSRYLFSARSSDSISLVSIMHSTGTASSNFLSSRILLRTSVSTIRTRHHIRRHSMPTLPATKSPIHNISATGFLPCWA